METSMNISQISANARQVIHESEKETIYSDLVVRTLISTAMKGRNECYINFERNQFCRGIGRPTDVLRETLIRIINSDVRLVGVTISVWNNKNNTVHFRW